MDIYFYASTELICPSQEPLRVLTVDVSFTVQVGHF